MLRLFLGGPAGFADARTLLEEADLPAGETTIVHKLIAHRATRPAAAQHRLITVETLLTDFAVAGLDPQQHRFPLTGGFTNTHGAEV